MRGDFNCRFNRDIALDYAEDAGLWQAIDDDGAESKCWGAYYKDFIDHVVFDPKAKQKHVDGSLNQSRIMKSATVIKCRTNALSCRY